MNGCPNNGGNEHRYFIFKTFETYVPVDSIFVAGKEVVSDIPLYQKLEYANINCQCGDIRKTEVKELDNVETA